MSCNCPTKLNYVLGVEPRCNTTVEDINAVKQDPDCTVNEIPIKEEQEDFHSVLYQGNIGRYCIILTRQILSLGICGGLRNRFSLESSLSRLNLYSNSPNVSVSNYAFLSKYF